METIVGHSEVAEINSELGTVSVVQVIPGQAIQVQVIGSDGDNAIVTDEDAESRKRRELLARRPSYRRILNELSATDHPGTITVTKIEEESEDGLSSNEDDGATNLTTHVGGIPIQSSSLLQSASLKMMPAQTLQIAAQGDGAAQGLQTLTMTNVSTPNTANQVGGATLVQYAQAADGQFLIPVSSLGGGTVQYQLAGSQASLPQGVVMASAGGVISSTGQVPEVTTRKRQLRLLKNREAARECRRKKKKYVKCLENRVAVLENQNKTLIEELKSLKELYCQKEVQS